MRCAVIGAGSWGTALANHLAQQGFEVRLWAHEAENAAAMLAQRENRRFLPGIPLAAAIHPTHDLAHALEDAELVVLVVPSHAVREVTLQASPFLKPGAPIVIASKGIEVGTLFTMTEVLEDVLPVALHPYIAVLSGPSFALELAKKLPTAVTVAARWERIAKQVQTWFGSPYLRLYTSPDLVGVELGGAVKNVIAIGAGIAEGLGFGSNSRAALITRGLLEISRLAVKKGANPLTLSGLSGMGDLVLTCTGDLSRNRQVGLELGRGKKLADILAAMTMVAEGVNNARSVHDLAKKLTVEMPICEGVYRVLYEDLSVREGVAQLMSRDPKAELA
jgi:glycerol-3-phosphate dehydrogenase (NAD(P)+)